MAFTVKRKKSYKRGEHIFQILDDFWELTDFGKIKRSPRKEKLLLKIDRFLCRACKELEKK